MLTRDGTAELVSQDKIHKRERGQGNTSIIRFSFSADHEQDWQPYPVDPYSCYIYVMTMQTYNIRTVADRKMCATYSRENTECGGRLFIIHFIPMVGVGKDRRTLIGLYTGRPR